MELNIKLLKAAAIATSTDKTRFYLSGVAVQAGDTGVYIVATDGHRALAFRQSSEAHAPVDIIIPTDIIAGIKASKYVEIAELTRESDTRWRIEYCGAAISFAPIDGTFPDWRRIVPNEVSGELAQFDPAYIGDFAKVAKALKKSAGCVTIHHNGTGPALVSFDDDIDGFGLLMPRRTNDLPNHPPSWAK